MFDQQLDDAPDADLFLVAKVTEPAGEFVGALNLPRHISDYATGRIMRQGLYSGSHLQSPIQSRAITKLRKLVNRFRSP